MRSGVAICAFLILANCALAQEHVASVAPPNQFEIARRTFFDFGPPFDYYELFFVRPYQHRSFYRKDYVNSTG